MKIPQGMLEEFKRGAYECIMQAKKKDTGTLQYDWFLSTDKTECEIHEAFESSEAALEHQSNLSEALRSLFEKFGRPHSVIIYGDPSPELLLNAKGAGLDITLYSFFRGV